MPEHPCNFFQPCPPTGRAVFRLTQKVELYPYTLYLQSFVYCFPRRHQAENPRDENGAGPDDAAAESQVVAKLEEFFRKFRPAVEGVQYPGDLGKIFQPVIKQLESLAAVNDDRQLKFFGQFYLYFQGMVLYPSIKFVQGVVKADFTDGHRFDFIDCFPQI